MFKTNQTKLDLTKYLTGFEMSKSAAQLLYAPVLVNFMKSVACGAVDRAKAVRQRAVGAGGRVRDLHLHQRHLPALPATQWLDQGRGTH